MDPRAPRALASEALRRQLQPGEQMTASAAVLSAPPGWAVAGLLLVCLAEVAAAVLGFLGLVPGWLPGRSIGLGLPGGQRSRLDARAAWREDFAAVADALARAGAFASLEPPYPALEQPRNP